MNAQRWRLPVCVGLLACVLPAQVEWQMENPRASATVVRERAFSLQPRRLTHSPAGRAHVHFPVDADGKPMSLTFDVEDGDSVVVGARNVESANARELALPIEGGFDGELIHKGRTQALQIHTTGERDLDAANYRVAVTVESQQNGTFGIVARHDPNAGCYVLSVEWESRVLRLERWMGGDHVVIAKTQLSSQWGEHHRLALQVDGFRLRAFVDDAMVMQSFDGALRRGAVGIAWIGERASFREVTMAEPAIARESVAIVQRRGEAVVHAATMVPPGNFYVLELSLDRPHPPVPRSPAGLEPWLLQTPAAPVVLLCDWRSRPAENGLGEVPVAGRWSTKLQLPTQAWLSKEVALARLRMVSGSGEVCTGSMPPVRVIF